MKTKKLALAGALGLLCLTSAGCGVSASSPTSTDPEIAQMQADYPHYSSTGQLSDDASLIVEGIVQESRSAVDYPSYEGNDPKTNPYAGTGKTPSQEEIEAAGVPITVSKVLVTKVHRGDAAPGDVIEIQQLGGTVDNVKYVEEGTQKVTPTEPYLLFLDQAGQEPAFILGGDAGLFKQTTEGTFSSTVGQLQLNQLDDLQ